MSDVSRVEQIFLAAVSQSDPDQRAKYLDGACGDDADLRRRVETLLAAHPHAEGFLEPVEPGKTHEYVQPETQAIGTMIANRYSLVEVIGEGGMGTVWRAKQSEPVKRYVALKLIKPGMDSKQVLARFEAERQALAMMDHPNIARILDGGIHDNRPFFVMELVKGTPITEFCDARKLTPQQRLELFMPVCQAIQHAHQKGIIHRDIKPSNVLIALNDDKPVPKVIDFGVAKATGGALTQHSIDTGFGSVVGTPQYMSPEQATFNNLDIDTRSDVYSLGTLLYELLAGSPPFAQQELEKRGLLEILRVVREEEPQRPSLKLSTAEARASISANRSSEPAQLSSMMKGEIDWIVMKALEKDRTRRYDTATALAKDVQRYLNGDAVEACPPTLGYRMRKAYRRNRTAVLVAGAFVMLMCVAVVVSSLLAIKATRAESLAKQKGIESEANAIEAQKNSELYQRESEAHMRSSVEAKNTACSLQVDLDLAEMRTNPRVGLLRLARPLTQGWNRKNLQVRLAGENSPPEELPNQTFEITIDIDGKFKELREFVTAAVLTTGQNDAPLLPPLSHGSRSILTQRLSRDGRSVLTLDEDGIARLLDLKTSKINSTFREKDEVVLVTDFSPDGATLFTCDSEMRVRIWHVERGVLLSMPELPKERSTFPPEMPLAKRREIATAANNIFLCNKHVFVFGIVPGDVDLEKDVAPISRIRNHVYTYAHCYNASNGQLIRSLYRDGQLLKRCNMSPDGRWLTVIQDQSEVLLISTEGGAEVARLSHPVGETCVRVAVSPEGGRIVTTCKVPKNGEVEEKWIHRLWEPNPWHVIPEPNLAKRNENVAIEFSNEDAMVITETKDTTGIWGPNIISYMTSSENVRVGVLGDDPHGDFAFNGRLFGTSDGRFYDAKTFKRIPPPLGRKFPDSLATFAPDSRFVFFGRSIIDTQIEKRIELNRSWETLEVPGFIPGFGTFGFDDYDKSELRILPSPDRLNIPPALLQLWAQVVVRGELGPEGEFVNWKEETWEQKRKELAAAKPPYEDFPFPGYVATDKLHWLRAEYKAATDDIEKRRLIDELLRRSEESGDKNEAVRWQKERAKYVSEAATPEQHPTSP
jgi:WD40 repeat protein